MNVREQELLISWTDFPGRPVKIHLEIELGLWKQNVVQPIPIVSGWYWSFSVISVFCNKWGIHFALHCTRNEVFH